jgi:hypothetical protein
MISLDSAGSNWARSTTGGPVGERGLSQGFAKTPLGP